MASALMRGLAAALALAAAATATAGAAAAQGYPDRPVRVLVGFPAGSGADILSRYFIDRLGAAVSGR